MQSVKEINNDEYLAWITRNEGNQIKWSRSYRFGRAVGGVGGMAWHGMRSRAPTIRM